jgi:undecaprenyl diphosphate synthase
MNNRFSRIPFHIGIIPDGNRRWAQKNNMEKQEGYQYGLAPGIYLYELCLKLGIKELTFYGFTQDNTKRPQIQTKAFQKACVDAVMRLANRDANLLVIGNDKSPLFPEELLPYANKRISFGKGLININFLVNYSWSWDLSQALTRSMSKKEIVKNLGSSDVSRIDLIIRWGGRQRLSGFLPVQSVYADFYVINEYWPDFMSKHLYSALNWYQTQDVTLGGEKYLIKQH